MAGDRRRREAPDSVRDASQLNHQRPLLDSAPARRRPADATQRRSLSLCRRPRDDAADHRRISKLRRPHPRALRFLPGPRRKSLPNSVAAEFPSAPRVDRHVLRLVAPRFCLVAPALAGGSGLHFPLRARPARLRDHRRKRRGIVGSLERGAAVESNGRRRAGPKRAKRAPTATRQLRGRRIRPCL